MGLLDTARGVCGNCAGIGADRPQERPKKTVNHARFSRHFLGPVGANCGRVCPVTPEVAGSSPVGPANNALTPPVRVAFLLMGYWVYILQSEPTGRSYVDHTNNLDDRLRRHNEGRTPVNKGRGPWRLVYQETCRSREAAVARERAIKARKSRAFIEALCSRAPVG